MGPAMLLERIRRAIHVTNWFDLLVCVWLLLAFAFPDVKCYLPVMGGSPGSSTQGANPYLAEAGALLLGMLTVSSGRLTRLPQWVWIVAVLWGLVIGTAAFIGLSNGHNLRSVLIDFRFAMPPLYLAVLSVVTKEARMLLCIAAVVGWSIWALMLVGVFVVEPNSMADLNVMQVPVPSFIHDLSLMWLFPVAAMGLALLFKWPLWQQMIVAGIGWLFVWLSYLRSLWIGWPVAVVVGAVAMLLTGNRSWWRFLLGQFVGFISSLAVVWLTLYQVHPGAAYHMNFRIYGLARIMGIVEPKPIKFKAPDYVPKLMRHRARTGNFFTELGNEVDASLSDRGHMARKALDAFQASPLTGRGLGLLYTYRPVPSLERVYNNPHNGYLWTLSKTGLFGGLGFTVLLGFIIRGWWTLRRSSQFFTFAGTVGTLFLVCELLQCGLGEHTVALPLAIIVVLRPREQGSGT